MNPSLLTVPDYRGRHNTNLDYSRSRLNFAQSAKDLSTICIVPSNGLIPAKIVERWLAIGSQMNQKFMRLPTITENKNLAYNQHIEQILANPMMNKFKYILTMEEDILPPFDGLIRLFESIDNFDVVGGLAYTRGETSQPMLYGQPLQIPNNYLSTPPLGEGIQVCLGVSTAFTLFRLDIFRDERVPRPWFRVLPPFEVGKKRSEHDDMFFFENIHKLGYKVACDTRVKLGHLDATNDIIW